VGDRDLEQAYDANNGICFEVNFRQVRCLILFILYRSLERGIHQGVLLVHSEVLCRGGGLHYRTLVILLLNAGAVSLVVVVGGIRFLVSRQQNFSLPISLMTLNLSWAHRS
jgi:hypothetical protein